MTQTTTEHPLSVNDAQTAFAHKEGCPGDRVETYEALRAPKPEAAIPATPLLITRCIDCGNHDVREK